ncbi:MAG: helix-turn-helix domain-containing protein [Gammaproteobacteria bacterium]|nr:helix-turn-helix domain-containing protein [Gammaproteobacteria bacterium]
MIPITSPETLGKALRHHRKLQGLSQTEAGRKFNLTQTMVSNVESGVEGVQMSTVFRYMSALGLEMSLSPRTKAGDEEALW